MPAFVQRLLALCLLAFWLPATVHCTLEALTDSCHETIGHACAHDTDNGHRDSCEIIENGDYFAQAQVLTAEAPQLTLLLCLEALHAYLERTATPVTAPAWSRDNPNRCVSALVFTTRAALPARAPNSV